MTLYLITAKQDARTWARLMQHPVDRAAQSKADEHMVAGRSLGYWYGLGGTDIYALVEAPDERALAPLILNQKASGAFTDVSVTVLLTTEEMLQALADAKALDYSPPGGSTAGAPGSQAADV
jgi:uncharacterized protein with GYD domain